MKRIKSYTVGWDTKNKQGYVSLIDEQEGRHLFDKIPNSEFSMILLLLKENQLFLDNQNWLIAGWNENY